MRAVAKQRQTAVEQDSCDVVEIEACHLVPERVVTSLVEDRELGAVIDQQGRDGGAPRVVQRPAAVRTGVAHISARFDEQLHNVGVIEHHRVAKRGIGSRWPCVAVRAARDRFADLREVALLGGEAKLFVDSDAHAANVAPRVDIHQAIRSRLRGR